MRLLRQAACLVVGWLVACGTGSGPACEPAPDADNPAGIRLCDVTEQAIGFIDPGQPRVLFSYGSGASVGDVDGDGDLDIVLARIRGSADPDTGGPPVLLRNQTESGGPPQFIADEGFSTVVSCEAYGTALGDYDVDGDADLFVACDGPDHLYQNQGDGNFIDVTQAAAVAGLDVDASAGALWVDVDNDGLLDLYVTNYTRGLLPPPQPEDANRLHLNLGDGTFIDISAVSGTASPGASHAAAAADVDADGLVDLVVANDAFAVDEVPMGDSPRDALYVDRQRDGSGMPVFTDRAAERGLTAPRSSMGVGLADFDDDGDLDIHVSDWGANDLYLWDGVTGGYREAAADLGLSLRTSADGVLLVSWGAAPLDLDRDGALELMVVNGAISGGPLAGQESEFFGQRDYYLRQPAPGSGFVDISASAGIPAAAGGDGQAINGRGVFTGDLDGDGDDDVVMGAYAEPYRVYQNHTQSSGHHVRLRLRGTVSAVDPAGAVVTVIDDDGGSTRRQRIIGGQPYGHGDAVIEIGLADRLPVQVLVDWPSGYRQRADLAPGFAIDQEVAISEPAWLTLSARTAVATDPVPVLDYTAVDEAGQPVGGAAAGRAVDVARSDGVPVTVQDRGDGTYRAELPHPGVAGRTVLDIEIDGQPLPIHPAVVYR